MADFVATDVTYNFDLSNSSWLGRRGKLIRGTLSFGNGSITYATGGIPLTIGGCGCPNFLESLIVTRTITGLQGFKYDYDRTNSKLIILSQTILTGATAAAALANGALPLTSSGTESAARLATSAASTSYDIGPMRQIPNATTLAALVIECEAIGW